MKVEVWSIDNVYVRDLVDWSRLRVLDALNSEGSFACEVPLAELDSLPWWSVLKVRDDAARIVFAALFRRTPRNTLAIDRSEQAGRIVGAGVAAGLGSSGYGGAALTPDTPNPQAAATRMFGWMTRGYDDSAWSTPHSYGTFKDPSANALKGVPDVETENEVQTIVMNIESAPFPWGSSYPSTGTAKLQGWWRIKHRTRWTANIAHNASNTTIKARLEAIGANIASVSGSNTTASPLTITFGDGKGHPLLRLAHDQLRHGSHRVRRGSAGSRTVDPQGLLENWPDDNAHWLGRLGVTNYLRRFVEVSANMDAAAGPARIFVGSIGESEVYWESQRAATLDGMRIWSRDIDLQEWDHQLGIRSFGPVVVTIVKLDDAGEPGAVLYRSDDDGDGKPRPWKGLANPADEPGETLMKIVRTIVAESQARGWFPALTTTFTDTHDSYGEAASTLVNFGWGTGTKLFWVLQQMAQWGLDFAVNPTTLALSVWQERGVNRTASVVYSPANRNVLESRAGIPVVHDVEGPMVTAVVVHTEDGWEYRHAASRDTYGVWEDGAHFGDAPSVRHVEDPISTLFETSSHPTWEGVLTTDGDAGALPMVDCHVGDRVMAIGVNGAAAPARLESVAMEVDDLTGTALFQLRVTGQL